MILTRRFLVVLALMFWQGGFMFYGAVTVPITREILGAQPNRSQITAEVTQWMNLAGTVALLVMFLDAWMSPHVRRRWRWVGWAVMAIPHPIVIWMHHEMMGLMAVAGFHSSDMREFRPWHQIYLLLNTLQWLGGMMFLVQSLKAWRAEDAVVKSLQSETATTG